MIKMSSFLLGRDGVEERRLSRLDIQTCFGVKDELPTHPAASTGVSSPILGHHSVLDTELSTVLWIPAFAGMTKARQVPGKSP
jgi:hypothetical protein